jgi:Rrf2 family protein
MMAISARGRYSVRILVLLASVASGKTLTKQAIAQAESISAPYVVQLMLALRAAGLVVSRRGRSGGFALARSPETITVAQVLHAVEGEIRPAPCMGRTTCERLASCPTYPMWAKAVTLLTRFFEEITIADLASGRATWD